MTKKCFVLSWFYPPINSSESMVTYKLLKYSKNKYDVWTRKNRSKSIWDRAIEESDLVSDNITILFGESSNVNEWVKEAIEYFEKHIDEYDCFMTRSMPPEAHYFGKELKKRHPEMKWIASFGDPIINTPYVDNPRDKNPYTLKQIVEDESPSRLRTARIAISPMRNAQRFVWKKRRKACGVDVKEYRRIHDFTIKGADLIISNNDYQLDHLFAGGYAPYKEKGVVIHHPYDMALFPPETKKANKKLVFTYTGHLDDTRNASILLKALNKLAENDPKLADKIKVDFYGYMPPSDKLYIMDHKLYSVVELHGDVSYADSLGILRNSDWLLLFDANFTYATNINIYFPAKLADYIGANRNILAITQATGASADIVRKVGGGLVCTHSADEVYIYLSKILYKNWKPEARNDAEAKKFDAKYIDKELDNAIEKVLA